MMFFYQRHALETLPTHMHEVASNDPVDWKDQPSDGLAIQGQLSHILKLADSKSTSKGDNLEEKLADTDKADGESSEKKRNVVAFYKLERIRISLITAQGDQTEVEDVRKEKPDVVSHASAGIISRLEETDDKLAKALRSLCWRYYGIQAEEEKVIGLEFLSFDLRLCAGEKIESLRFAFSTRIDVTYERGVRNEGGDKGYMTHEEDELISGIGER
ncbi:unnamed protein product [Eruca vesicaria subsp. sativa]|uniref:Uncharacterized protein n=1 Tax=Eruca vesicaria subsp. sativa TaxID=29727 RepID=A0ABC8J9E1_ERUVS|nr:unnamed protein product [Eruca vesicaria subsp. sativa]